jgi:hypothetical protein
MSEPNASSLPQAFGIGSTMRHGAGHGAEQFRFDRLVLIAIQNASDSAHVR